MKALWKSFLIMSLVPQLSFAGSFLEYSGIQNGKKQSLKLSLESTRLHVDSVGDKGENVTVIYDASANKMIQLNHKNKQANIIDVAQMKKKMKEMSDMFKNIPEEQRKMMAGMMNKMPGMNNKKIPVIKLNKMKTETIKTQDGKSWNTTLYNVTQDGKKVSSAWVVPANKVNVNMNDFKVLEKMATEFKSMMKDMPMAGSMPQDLSTAFDSFKEGAAVKFTNFDNSQSGETFELVDSKTTSFPDSLFQVPNGYKAQKMSMGE